MNEQQSEAWRGKVGKLSQEEMEAFLATDVLCRLACVDNEGWPYVVPTWFQYKDGGFYIIPRERSAWAEYMVREPRVSLLMDVPGSLEKVLVKGRAECVERPNVGGKWVAIGEEMSLRYLGPNGPKYLVPTLNEPRWLFFVKPEKITTWQGVDWASKYKHSDWGEAGKKPAGS